MELISIKNCEIPNCIKKIDWTMNDFEAWLVIGANNSEKNSFLEALAGKKSFLALKGGLYKSVYESAEIVSLERAASLIEEERALDESEWLEKIDEGRTARRFICEVLGGPDAKHKNAPLPPLAFRLETFPEIKLCGIEKILDRGIKFLSTGEIRRVLLCRALLSPKKLLILSEPFAGLDFESKKILCEFFQNIVAKKTDPKIILSMERYAEIPKTITNVLEFEKGEISFCGKKSDYEKLLKNRKKNMSFVIAQKKREIALLYNEIKNEIIPKNFSQKSETSALFDFVSAPLVQMKNVNVGWGEKLVLKNFSWTVNKGEHWLIRGPNGSGKTTILELITGDNMQVFSNDVRLFGKKRGSGESIWEIKQNLGISSYRLHVEYRMLGSTDIEGVLISGFRDTIGLYEQKTDGERTIAARWLHLGGFFGRENEQFSNLSYGEQRAILILRAAVKHPKLLILDEPCHALDEENREKILTLLDAISKTGTTTILHVTHDPSETLECEKHILELRPTENPMYKIFA